MREAGKGSKQRPTNHEAYGTAWDRIFGKKVSSEGTPPVQSAEAVTLEQSTLTEPTVLPVTQAAEQPTQAHQ